MLTVPQILTTEAQPAAIIRLTIPRGEMMRAFGPAAGELMGELARQGVAPAGPLFAHHLRMSADQFDFELGVPVAAPVKAAGRVAPGALPAARVVRATYIGPYEGLPDGWSELMAWMKAEGLAPAEDLWEVYATGPAASPDPANWRTELNRPIAD